MSTPAQTIARSKGDARDSKRETADGEAFDSYNAGGYIRCVAQDIWLGYYV